MFLLTLLLAVGACAAAVVEDAVPNYNKFVQDYTEAKKLVIDLSKPTSGGMIPDWSLPSRKRDYIQLVAFLDAMTNDEPRSIPYDEYYDVLNKTVPYAWENPNSVLVGLQAGLRKIDSAIAIMVKLVDKYCGTTRSLKDVECNTFVDLEVKKDQRTYQPGAATLKALGKLAEMYVKEPYGSKSHNYEMVQFLLNGKDEIKPLILNLGHLRRVMKLVY